MQIEFHPAAFRHGISEERSRYVIAHCRQPIHRPKPGDRDLESFTLFLGPDWNGIPLEVLGVERQSGLLVIHAMRLRRKYRAEYIHANP